MSKNVREKAMFLLFSLLSALVLCFIFSHSILSKEESGALSGWVMEIIKPLLDPHNRLDPSTFHLLIRKTAHFAEFAALGFCVMGATVNLGSLRGRKYFSLPMLITLACAVSDEYLQYFTGRGSMVTDVVLDYAGALFGIAVLSVICSFIRRKNSK